MTFEYTTNTVEYQLRVFRIYALLQIWQKQEKLNFEAYKKKQSNNVKAEWR